MERPVPVEGTGSRGRFNPAEPTSNGYPYPASGGVGFLERLALPNDEFALYGGGDFKVRILTTGGFSPDGLTGVTPDQFSDFFRLHATGPDSEELFPR